MENVTSFEVRDRTDKLMKLQILEGQEVEIDVQGMTQGIVTRRPLKVNKGTECVY